MQSEHDIVVQVYEAKGNVKKADQLIREYVPFIRSQTSKFLSRVCIEQDDEFSIAMIAFHEAIQGYKKDKGTFLSYASMLIHNRLIDYQRKEMRHYGQISIFEKKEEDEQSLQEELADERDLYEEYANLEATKQEIEELSAMMKEFGVTFTDVADNSPKQDRTLESCKRVIQYVATYDELLDELLRTKRLPIKELVQGAKVERKTLERHRKYILVMLLTLTNGYEIIRGHLKHVLRPQGGAVS